MLKGVQKGGKGKDEHPAVPKVASVLQEAAGGGQIRLFDESMHLVTTLPQVLTPGAISGLRAGGGDPKGDKPFPGGQGQCLGHGLLPHGLVVDEMIGGEDGYEGLGVVSFNAVQAQDDGRQGVASQGLAYDLILKDRVHALELFADLKDMLFIGHDPDPVGGENGHDPGNCLLQQRPVAV